MVEFGKYCQPRSAIRTTTWHNAAYLPVDEASSVNLPSEPRQHLALQEMISSAENGIFPLLLCRRLLCRSLPRESDEIW